MYVTSANSYLSERTLRFSCIRNTAHAVPGEKTSERKKRRFNMPQTERFVTPEPTTPNPRVQGFLNEVVDLCARYGLSIAHEDHHGAFIIEDYDQTNIDWLLEARYAGDLPEKRPQPWLESWAQRRWVWRGSSGT